MLKQFLFSSVAVCALTACNNQASQTKDKTPKSDILLTNIDSTIKPADDFFDYAEGGWLKKNQIPGDETHWGIGNLVDNELYSRLRNINEEAVKNRAKGGLDQKIADFWSSGMDSVALDQSGYTPLQPELAKISNVKSVPDIISLAAEMHRYGVGVFFSEGVSQDQMNSEVMTYYMLQGGLGLPNRDYYFNTDSRTAMIRAAYPGYLATIFRLIGNDSAAAAAKAKNVWSVEVKLAQSSRKLADLRDPYRNYNKYAISNLKTLAPGIDWPKMLTDMGVKNIDSVVVGQPEFFKQLSKVMATEPLESIKDYMSFHLVRTFAPYLSQPFANASFEFYSKTIRGAQEMRPRWKRVLDAEESAMGEALGQLFVKEYFNENAKKRYETIVENVRNAYKERIKKLDWMSDSTKQKALAKLAAIRPKVGYPDKWKNLSGLKVEKGPYATNIMNANRFWNDYEMNKLGKPVDRNEWEMTPQTYNAYYNPSNNEIVLPAGIFTVPGYRDEELDDALVYGYAAASTIGHEITHGFDDEGRQYDEKGNLKNWWTKQDEEQFTKRAQVLVKQFNNIVVVDTLRINGQATLGENLADLGGILIGLDAFKQTETYKKGEKISGFTPLQRFFLGYALGWMYEIRKEQLANQLLTDVHSPAKYRVNGPFLNVPEFYEAFGIKAGDKMYVPDSLRVRLW